jgi:hypothetical protein
MIRARDWFLKDREMPDLTPSDDDALRFFREIVEPTVAEFMAARDDKRRGCPHEVAPIRWTGNGAT